MQRIRIRKIRYAPCLKLNARKFHEQIVRSFGFFKNAIAKYVGLAAAAGLDRPAVLVLDDTSMERRLIAAPDRPR